MPVPPFDPETAEPQTLDEIRDWRQGIVEALVAHRASMQHAIREGSAVPDRFVPMTDAEVDAHFDAQRRELDRLTVLNLVASAEATIKTDYSRRVGHVGRKLKDPLTLAYRDWRKGLLRPWTVEVKRVVSTCFDCWPVRLWAGVCRDLRRRDWCGRRGLSCRCHSPSFAFGFGPGNP